MRTPVEVEIRTRLTKDQAIPPPLPDNTPNKDGSQAD